MVDTRDGELRGSIAREVNDSDEERSAAGGREDKERGRGKASGKTEIRGGIKESARGEAKEKREREHTAKRIG